MECYICSKNLIKGYLCKEHALELKKMIEAKEKVVVKPDWKHHCQICGEFEGRVIVEYPNAGYFCDVDISEELENYTKQNNN